MKNKGIVILAIILLTGVVVTLAFARLPTMDVIINEVLVTPDVNGTIGKQFIELINTTDQQVDLTDWWLQQGVGIYQFEEGAYINPQCGLVIYNGFEFENYQDIFGPARTIFTGGFENDIFEDNYTTPLILWATDGNNTEIVDDVFLLPYKLAAGESLQRCPEYPEQNWPSAGTPLVPHSECTESMDCEFNSPGANTQCEQYVGCEEDEEDVPAFTPFGIFFMAGFVMLMGLLAIRRRKHSA